jgi:eukaryotic-like serine/threonine-protein kinase
MALRVGFIQAEQLVASLHIWVDSKLEPIEKVLVRLGFLTEAHCALLTPVVNEFIQLQGGDARKGLSALSPIGNLYQQLKEIDDSGLNKSLAHLTVHYSPEGDKPTRLWQPNNERFRILSFHSQGGLGKVSVAFDGELGREVAFKEIRDEYANLQTARDRFIMEAEVTGRLEHPGIVPVYGLGHHPDGRPFYAMRFIRGNSLNSAIAAAKRH